MDKIENILFGLLLLLILIIGGTFIYILIDFKHDYECSTTSSVEWYNEHNCKRYERGDN